MAKNKKKPLLPGTFVRVRALSEIFSTLDNNGALEGLPFMPEMAKYCGQVFMVSRKIERTCEESEKGMRRIKNVVFLDNLRCDGEAHGSCQKKCMLFWKEAWLTTELEQKMPVEKAEDVEVLISRLPSKLSDDTYICQSTELIRATSPLSLFDFMSYIRDLKSRTYSIPELLKAVSYAFFLRIRYYLIGTPFRYLRGIQKQTPRLTLNLQPGELVRVKTKEEIIKTLDKKGTNRGLLFTRDMLRYCGKVYRVIGRVDKMIHEPTRRLIELKDTVILEDSVCKGCHIIRGGCPRANYNFWREIWLERVYSQDNQQPQNPKNEFMVNEHRANIS
jgi:hypothetical protein